MTINATLRSTILAALVIPAIAMTAVAATTAVSQAQQAGTFGGNTGGRGNPGGEGPSNVDPAPGAGGPSLIFCITHACNPPRRPKIENASMTDDCTCKIRTVWHDGRNVHIRDCYRIVHRTVETCQPVN